VTFHAQRNVIGIDKFLAKNNILFQKVNLKKISEIRRAKVFPKIKNGQKKCPIFRNGNTL